MTAGVIQRENLKAVMDAYRERTQTSANVSLVELPAKIRAIPGGGTYDISKAFAEKGTSSKASPIIIEPGTTKLHRYMFFYQQAISYMKFPDSLITIDNACFQNSNIAETNINDLSNLRTIGEGAFSASSITEVSNENITSLGSSAFSSSKIELANMPNAGVGSGVFSYCSFLQKATIGYLSSSCFSYCTKLTYVRATLATSTFSSFTGCTLLNTIVLDSVATIRANSLSGLGQLSTLVLKNASGVVLENVSAFTGTPFAADSTAETPTLYVPQALIDSQYYETATNWASLRFNLAPIEGSEYE